MKKTLVTMAVASITVLALMLTGCASAPKNRDDSVVLKAKNVNFKSEPGSLSITNDTVDDVVVFAGKVEKGCLLGGIKMGQARSFDLSKIPGIPDSGSLLIRVASYNTYRGKARITEEDVIYTGLVVYDLKDPGDRSSLTIYKGVDVAQKECIYASNESENYVLELRLGNPSQGEVIATLAPLERNKRIFMKPRDDGFAYDFYATWVYVNPQTNEKTAMNSGKKDRRRAYPEAVGGDITPMRFEGPSASSIGYDVAFINVQNDTSSGIEFRNGETTLKNQKGIRFTASGRMDVYEVTSENGESGQTYTGLKVEFDNSSKITIAPTTFMPGYKYELVITEMNGNYEYAIREVGMKSLVEDASIHLFME